MDPSLGFNDHYYMDSWLPLRSFLFLCCSTVLLCVICINVDFFFFYFHFAWDSCIWDMILSISFRKLVTIFPSNVASSPVSPCSLFKNSTRYSVIPFYCPPSPFCTFKKLFCLFTLHFVYIFFSLFSNPLILSSDISYLLLNLCNLKF